MKLDSRLDAFLHHQHFKQLTQIQAQSFPIVIADKDLIGLSKTGTGKTLAYLMPLFLKMDPELKRPQVLILVPTQELVNQVFAVAKDLADFFNGIKIQRVVRGQTKIDRNAMLMISTVGRMLPLLKDERPIQMNDLNTLVIDEADMMLEKDSLTDIQQLRTLLPNKLQMLVFSATLPLQLTSFMKDFMHHPKQVRVEKDKVFDPRHEHFLIPYKHQDDRILIDWLKHVKPALALVFLNDQQHLSNLSDALHKQGIEHLILHGDLSVRERQQRLKRLHYDTITIVLATDVAARGLDIEMVSDVVIMGLPKDLSFFTHRAGRTGRAGRSGRVTTFYQAKDDSKLRQLIRQGVVFTHQRLTSEGLKTMKPYGYVHKRRPSELDLEIQKRIKSQSKTVKPGYKKQLARDIETLKRRHKRQLIQDNIRKLQKEKSKAKQKALVQENS
jgi:ATP-dependent RNA helicase CshB